MSDNLSFFAKMAASVWLVSLVAKQDTTQIERMLEPYMDNATAMYNLPPRLLRSVAYQESRFRPDIVYGHTKSSAGAVGLMQIMPAFHPDVNPTDPYQSIRYAAKYLRYLYDELGTWPKALAAYNWGIGNVKTKGMANMPTETRNYVDAIMRDVQA